MTELDSDAKHDDELPENIPPDPETAPTHDWSTGMSPASLGVAIIWAIAAVIFAIVLLAGAQDASYGGDAYTGIQNAVMLAVRGIAFLLFGSAALGIVIATRQDRR
jgi:small-conductance mechanosensitive channel